MPEQPKIQFTPAQAAAISARGGSLLVSAAAGSGKTRVLVERVVGLITDPVHPVDANQLLIMTFTNAAAAKLRADITTRLAQEVRAHPGDLHLRSQQLLLQRASIGTVDAFCLHFVQQHFAMLDVPPDFETADEADLARIEQETLAATLETAYQDPDFRAFADLYDRGRTDNTAGDAILDLYHFTRALPHPAASLAAFAAMWQQDAPPKDTLWGKELLGIALARAQGAKTLLESGAAIAARDEAADRAYTAVMQDDAARVKNLCYYLKEGNWDKSLAALDAVLTGWRRAGSVKGFAAYEGALRTAGIPVFADSATDLLDEPHIRPFAALLRVIDNPAQDIPLAAVLLSPMFPYTADDLVALRRARPTGSLYGAVLYSEPQRFALFTDALTEYRRLARTLPVDELIEELLARTGYLAAVGALPDGPRCREDLLSFTAWAAGAGRAGLPSLIRAMDAAAANGGLSQSAGGQTRPGCVSIMTVHRSKGLEFPVVFVADTDHKFNQSDAIRPVLTHSRLGVGVMLRAPRAAKRFKTLPYAALAQAIRTETLSEEMRVLYVALTRAQDALIITVPLKKTASSLKLPALCAAAEATGPEAMRSMTSWAGWILTAALLHPDSSALWEYTSFLPHYGLHRAPLAIRVLPLPEETEQPPAPPAPAADPAVVEMLKASFAWRSPREALEKVPAKVSVSAVAHAARPVALERPAFLQKTGMTGAERGTAIHAFMQSVPFDGSAPDLDAEVRRQTDLQLLDPALADKLDLNAVRPFFASAVWRRIRLAKQILREEPFITALPAAEVTPAAGQGSAAAAEVLVQGIADLVLVFDEHAEILDYKTDRSRDAQYYIDEYAAQLRLYRRAFAQRLAVPVTKLTSYSFAIEDEIDVPLA